MRFFRRLISFLTILSAIFLIVAASLYGCAPVPGSVSRLARIGSFPNQALPFEKAVTIHWNNFQVPFIEAQSDGDLAVALGMIHAHLRLAQMHILKRISQGRLSESAGPSTVDLDYALRVLGLGREAEQIIAAMGPDSRFFCEKFLLGVNLYQERLREYPPEFIWAGLDPEPFTLRDLVSIMRLAGADVSWFSYLKLLRASQSPDFAGDYEKFMKLRADSGVKHAPLQFLEDLSRSGSNSLLLSGALTHSGKPLLMNDPHLGMLVPNFWLLAGFKSPSYHAVGFMIPGLPFIALGRNRELAWGGTNMRAASSELVDVSSLPEDAFSENETLIKVRGWFDATRKIRVSKYGPVLSDASILNVPNGRRIALKWLGHSGSDEIGAFLRAGRARNVPEFRAAFDSYAVSAQNILVGDIHGNIAHIYAARLPRRPLSDRRFFIRTPAEIEKEWSDQLGTLDLPFVLNPSEGILVSANNLVESPETIIGYFFSPDDRVERVRQLVSRGPISPADAGRIQLDVYSAAARRLARALVERADRAGLHNAHLETLRSWNGQYASSSRGAAVFETTLASLADSLYGGSILKGWDYISLYLASDLDALPASDLTEVLSTALSMAGQRHAVDATWGDLHRLRIQHPFGNIPGLGYLFRFGDYPIAGSRETVFKTSHGFEVDRHYASYGTQSRHISDLSDPDENYFILLGGEDGWIESENFLDQVPLFLNGDYIRVPLRLESVRSEFSVKTELKPHSLDDLQKLAHK